MNVHRTKQANLLKYLEHLVEPGVGEGVWSKVSFTASP